VERRWEALQERTKKLAAAAATDAPTLRAAEAIRRGSRRKTRATRRRVVVSSLVVLWVGGALALIVALRTSSSPQGSTIVPSTHSSTTKPSTPARKPTPRPPTHRRHPRQTAATCAATSITAAEGTNAYLGGGEDEDALLLTNTSSTACEIGGFPTVSFFGTTTSSAPDLGESTAAATTYMRIPAAFAQVTSDTLTTLEPGQSAAVYYLFQTRATGSNCVMQDAGIDLSWSGSGGQVQYPTAPGLLTIEACAGAQVTFTQIGPAESPLLVSPSTGNS
jgi:hypothetical protein